MTTGDIGDSSIGEAVDALEGILMVNGVYSGRQVNTDIVVDSVLPFQAGGQMMAGLLTGVARAAYKFNLWSTANTSLALPLIMGGR